MTKIQKVLLLLLSEFHKSCLKLDIEYASADRLARDAIKFNGFNDKAYTAHLMMRRADFERLAEKLSNIPSRTCESYTIESSQFFRYVADDTTLIDLDSPQYFERLGIALTIQLLDESDSEGYVSYQFGGDKLQLPLSVLFPAKQVVFEGKPLFIPADFEGYFNMLISSESNKAKGVKTTRREQFSTADNMGSVIFTTKYAYQDFLKQPSVQEALTLEKHKQRQKYLQRQAELKSIIDKPDTYNSVVELTRWRFLLWEDYYPLRSKIEELLSANDVDALKEMFMPCMKILRVYTKKGIGLYFDPVVHEALLLLSEEIYGKDFTEKWTASIPEPHYEDVAQVLKRYKVDHPLLRQG